MNRRTVIKNLALIMGGTVLLPSCLHHDGTTYVQLKHIKLDEKQQSLIADICETIIPKTNTPGAKDLKLPDFVLKMIDDCYTKKDQLAFSDGLNKFDQMVKDKYNSSFGDLDVKKREEVLTTLEKNMKSPGTPSKSIKPVNEGQKSAEPQKPKPPIPPMEFCYQAIKQQTIFGYTNSEYFMTKQIVYELVPGRYNAHFPVKNLKNA